jgi:hypothetical protein
MQKKYVIITAVAVLTLALFNISFAGQTTVNGWYEGEEIYYINRGVENGIVGNSMNDIFLIGDVPRRYQANVVEFVPGENGYSPHWVVNIVHTAEGVTVDDIAASPYVSELWATEGVLFDDAADILGAWWDGLVDIVRPGFTVNCPIISEQGAEAPGNNEAPEDFLPFPDTF